MLNRTNTAFLAVAACAFVGAASMACSSTSSSKLAAEHSEERAELSEEQVTERAELERQQREEQVALNANQARDHVKANASAVKGEVSFEAEQSTFAIDAKEKLARLDARIVELQRLGSSIDDSTMRARDEVARHIAACDDEVMSREVWLKHKEGVSSELAALTNQVKREEAERAG